MKTIFVNSKDYGFFNQKYISVVRREDDEIIWCNHDSAELEEHYHDFIDAGGIDQGYVERLMVCPTCEAYKFEGEDYWYDAPFEGISQ